MLNFLENEKIGCNIGWSVLVVIFNGDDLQQPKAVDSPECLDLLVDFIDDENE